MNSSHQATREGLRALVLIVAWLIIPLMGALPGAAHAAVTGTVVAWGYNEDGQTNVPQGLRGVIAIAAGNDHTLALKSDGTVVAWGDNRYGQTTVPAGLRGVVAIAAGGYQTMALKSDGTVVAWGWSFSEDVPVGLRGVTAIAAGSGHQVALKSDGTVVAWGLNYSGQTNVPAGLRGVVAIAAGRDPHGGAQKRRYGGGLG